MTYTPPPTPIPPFVHHFRAADQKLILSKLETKKKGEILYSRIKLISDFKTRRELFRMCSQRYNF